MNSTVESQVSSALDGIYTRRGVNLGVALAGSVVAKAPSSMLGPLADNVALRGAFDILRNVRNGDPNRRLKEFIGGGVEEYNLRKMWEFYRCNPDKPIGEFFPSSEEMRVGDGVIQTDGTKLIVMQMRGTEDPRYSFPFFDITCTGDGYQRKSRAGILQGPQSNVTQTRLGFLPAGAYHIEVNHTQFSSQLGQENPEVSFFEVSSDNPLLQRFAFRLLGGYAQKTYEDSHPMTGFREDAPAASTMHFFLKSDEAVLVVNGINVKEVTGNIATLWKSRQGVYDVDAKRVGRATLRGESIEEGYQGDLYLMIGGKKINLEQHHVFKTAVHSPPVFLDESDEPPLDLQEEGEHGMLAEELKSDIFYDYMPILPWRDWRGPGWIQALKVAGMRQKILRGSLDGESSYIAEFAAKHLGGVTELITASAYNFR